MVSAQAVDAKIPARTNDAKPRMRPNNLIVRRPAAKKLISKARAKEPVLALSTYFSNALCRRNALRTLAFLCLIPAALAQSAPGPATLLYRRIGSLGLDPKMIYNVRDASIDREDIQISLDDGTIAFTESLNGHITGALFDGEGTVLIVPPNQVERHSLGMFTEAAVLNLRFTKAYFRFDDSRFLSDLKPYLQPLEEAAAFVEKENALAKTMSASDSLRLLVALMRDPTKTSEPLAGEFIHAHFVGERGL